MNVDLITLAQKLSTVGFPTLLILVLIGSRFKVWAWFWQLDDLKKVHEDARVEWRARLAEEIAEKNEWKTIALRNISVAKTAVEAHAQQMTGGPTP